MALAKGARAAGAEPAGGARRQAARGGRRAPAPVRDASAGLRDRFSGVVAADSIYRSEPAATQVSVDTRWLLTWGRGGVSLPPGSPAIPKPRPHWDADLGAGRADRKALRRLGGPTPRALPNGRHGGQRGLVLCVEGRRAWEFGGGRWASDAAALSPKSRCWHLLWPPSAELKQNPRPNAVVPKGYRKDAVTRRRSSAGGTRP